MNKPRLIDANAMITNMLEEKRFVFQQEDLLRGTMVFETVYKDLAEFINSQPTAYDIDEVTDKFVKEFTKNAFKVTEKHTNKVYTGVELIKAIEIVKGNCCENGNSSEGGAE